MSNSHRPSKNFGKQASDASNILASSQSKRAGKAPDRTSAFSGIANSTRSLFRSFLGGSVANGSSTNANLASILSNKPGSSTPFSGNAINPLESSSQWAESINNTSQTESHMEGSSAHHAFDSIGQRSVAGPSLEDELQHFEDVNTSSNSGQDYSENLIEQELDTSFVTERESIQPLNEEIPGTRFPLNNRFSLKSAPQVGLCVNNTESLLISPDKTATTSAESRAYAWADEFLSHFGENLIESPKVESSHENEEEFNTDNRASHPFESHNIPNYLSEQSLHITSENQRSIPSNNDFEVEFNSEPVELGHSFASAEPNTKSSLGSIIQSPRYLASEQDEFPTSQSEHGEVSQQNSKDLEELEEAWQQTFRGGFSNTQTDWPSETDGDDVVAFLNSTDFPEELLPSSSDISVVEQVYNGEDTYSEWAAEFEEEDEANLPESQQAFNESTKENGGTDWSTEFLHMGIEGDNLNHLHEDDQDLAEPNLLPFETSEDTDGNDVIAFLNSQEFPEELALNSSDKSRLEDIWKQSITDQGGDLDWSAEFNDDPLNQVVPATDISNEKELLSAFNEAFKEDQPWSHSSQHHELQLDSNEEYFSGTSDRTDGEEVVAFLNSEQFPDSLLPSKDVFSSDEDTYKDWLTEFDQTQSNNTDTQHNDGDDVVAFLNSSHFPKELSSAPEDVSSLEELWNNSLAKEWASEFSEASSTVDNKLVESSNSIEGWLEEFNNESVVSKGLERSFDVDTDFGDYDNSVNYLNEKYGRDASIVIDGAEVVELLGAGAFPFELTPDVTDLDEISELEMNVAENWFNEFQEYDLDSQQANNTIAEDAISFSDFENEIIEDWGHQFLDLPYLEEDVLSDLSESRPPTPPDGFEVVAFLDHSNFPMELTKVPEFLTSDAVRVYSAEEEQANQSHLQRWLDEFEDNQDSTKENPISGWMSEFSEIQDLLRQEIEYTEENEVDLFSEMPSVSSPMAYDTLAYRMNSLPKESSDIFDNWTKDFLKAELADNKSITDYGDDHISSGLDAQWPSNLNSSPNQILMLDKKESIESTIKDLIKEIANEITTEEFLYSFDYQESYGSVPDTYGVPIQTFDLEIARPDFDEKVTVSSEATKKNALDRLRQLRKHILGQ